MAVSKKFSAPHLQTAYRAGLRDFGENYVQEFVEKRPQLEALTDARFHLIGHLQSNKARVATEIFQVVQTVDSIRLLERLNALSQVERRNAAYRESPKLEVMIEVKLSAEESKHGAKPEGLPSLLEAAARCPNLSLSGLMTMPPWHADPEHSRPYFQQLASLGREFQLPKLSMGMSNDLEVAIEEGATLIRVGTALFGPRPKPQPGGF